MSARQRLRGASLRRLAVLLSREGHATAKRLAAVSGLTAQQVRRSLRALHESGECLVLSFWISNHEGPGRPPRYYSLDKPLPAAWVAEWQEAA